MFTKAKQVKDVNKNMATCHKAHLSPAINHVNNQWISSSIRFFSFFKKTLGWGADQIFICSLFELILMKLSEHTLWFRSHQSKASQMVKRVHSTTAFWGSLSPAQRQVNNQWIFSGILIFSFRLEKHWDRGQTKFWSVPLLSLFWWSQVNIPCDSNLINQRRARWSRRSTTPLPSREVFLLHKDKSTISEYSPVLRFSAFGWKSIETGGRPNFDLCPCWAYFDEVKWIYLVIPILSIKGEPDGQEGLQHRCLLGSLSPAQKQVNNQWMFLSISIFSFWLEKH